MPELELAKRKLSDNLKDRMGQYWEYMKDWYKRKVCRPTSFHICISFTS